MKVGDYEPFTHKKKLHEAFIEGIKEHEIFWTIYTEDGGYDTKSQDNAIIISKLIKIEKMLEEMKK